MQKGAFWDEKGLGDRTIAPFLETPINAPHVPTWILRVYKEYHYDVFVATKLNVHTKCPCGKQILTKSLKKHQESQKCKAWHAEQLEM